MHYIMKENVETFMVKNKFKKTPHELALSGYLTEELDSFKSAPGAFKPDLQHNLDGLLSASRRMA